MASWHQIARAKSASNAPPVVNITQRAWVVQEQELREKRPKDDVKVAVFTLLDRSLEHRREIVDPANHLGRRAGLNMQLVQSTPTRTPKRQSAWGRPTCFILRNRNSGEKL